MNRLESDFSRIRCSFVQVNVFSESSSYGISEGRISRLTVYSNQQKEFSKHLANYDRDWEGKPPGDSMIRAVIKKVVR